MYFIRLSDSDYFGNVFYLVNLSTYTRKVGEAKSFNTLDGAVEYAKRYFTINPDVDERYSTMPFVLEVVNNNGSVLSVVSKRGL